MANSEWKHVGSSHVFRKAPPKKPDFGWVWALVLFIGIVFLLGQCAG